MVASGGQFACSSGSSWELIRMTLEDQLWTTEKRLDAIFSRFFAGRVKNVYGIQATHFSVGIIAK